MALSVVRSEASPAELLARLRAGDSRPLDDLYRIHRPAFVRWAGARHSGLSEADLADAFQSAIIAFYENITSGRLTELTAQPSTYVFALGERFCLKLEKTSAKTINNLTPSGIKGNDNSEMPDPNDFSHFADLPDDPFELAEFESSQTEQAEPVARALRQLPPDCHRLLTTVYYGDVQREELMAAFGYQSPNVLAVRKSQCLARLRTLCGVGGR